MESVKALKTHLDKAYQYLSKLQVSGDAVDLVAMVRIEMRNAWAEIEKVEAHEGAKKELMANASKHESGCTTGETEAGGVCGS